MICEGTAVTADAGFGNSATGDVIGTRVTTCGGATTMVEYLIRFHCGGDVVSFVHDDGNVDYIFLDCDGEKAWINAEHVRPNVVVQGQDEAKLRTVPLERPVGRKDK